MTDQNNWEEMSDDIADISKKIKNNISGDENIDDLKDSLINIKENVMNTFNKLAEIVENTLNDEEVKNCLLYTSPSPRDKSSSRMPSSA